MNDFPHFLAQAKWNGITIKLHLKLSSNFHNETCSHRQMNTIMISLTRNNSGSPTTRNHTQLLQICGKFLLSALFKGLWVFWMTFKGHNPIAHPKREACSVHQFTSVTWADKLAQQVREIRITVFTKYLVIVSDRLQLCCDPDRIEERSRKSMEGQCLRCSNYTRLWHEQCEQSIDSAVITSICLYFALDTLLEWVRVYCAMGSSPFKSARRSRSNESRDWTLSSNSPDPPLFA